MKVALISIGNCPSLALRNLRAYAAAQPDLAESISFRICDYEIRGFRDARTQSARQWSWVTKLDEALSELVQWNPDLAAFSCYLWNTDLSLHFAHLLKRAVPKILTLFGGPDAGPRAIELLGGRDVDYVVEGEGEIPFVSLLRTLESGGRELATVPALRYRNGERTVLNPPTTEQTDLSSLRDLYEDELAPAQLSRWYWPYLLYETLRGCPYPCSYCMYGKTKMHEKDVDLVVEELVGLLARGFTVEITDPTFTTYKNRAKRILKGLASRSYSGRLQLEAYADSIDEEMAELLKAARTSCIGIGFQTISAEGLRAVKRPKNLARFERGVKLLDQQKLHYYVDLIFGLPETTVEDFLASVDYLYSLGITRLMMYRLLGLPGSPMMADVNKHHLVFSGQPPYELLSSGTCSLDDIVFCDRFQHAFPRVLAAIPEERLRRLAEREGGITRLVKRAMELESDDHELIRRALDPARRALNSPSRNRRDTHSASSPASRNIADSVAKGSILPS